MVLLFDKRWGDELTAFQLAQRVLQKTSVQILMWELEDPNDLGSFRMVYSSHTVSPTNGLDYTQLVGTTLAESFPALLKTDVPGLYAEALRTQRPVEIPDFFYAEGRTLESIYRLRAIPVAERLVGVVVENVSQAERVKHEQDEAFVSLKRRAKELERSNLELDQFAYVASHDLKAPLRDIENLVNWLIEDLNVPLPENCVRHVERLHQRIHKMRVLLEELLNYSRVGRVFSGSEDLDLNELLEKVEQNASLPAGFILEIPTGLPTIHSARSPLMSIFANLIDNAVKHHDRTEGRIQIGFRELGLWVEFTVTDDGPGIPAAYHEKVFGIFQTLKPYEQTEGSGIGLAIVKKLVEAHDGQIKLESEGRGTTLRFTWPKHWQI